jgi:CHAD domain-containing protein
MADGKWIAELKADTSLADAARRALRARLHVVRDCLPLVAAEPPRDPEHVHQLRVATRRAAAALRIFATCLPQWAAKRVRRRLRRLRRAAGDARDWDVFALHLLERLLETTAKARPGLDYLLGYAAGQRAAAQARLLETARKEVDRFDEFLAQTLEAVRAPDQDDRPLLELAKPLLTQLVREFAVQANGDLNDYAQLHQVRIAGKRLRYAMELFAACFDESFKETLYPQIEEIQEVLGRANDSHVAVVRLETIRVRGRATLGAAWKTIQPGVAALAQFHRRRSPRERRTFVKWWEEWQKNGVPIFDSSVRQENAKR